MSVNYSSSQINRHQSVTWLLVVLTGSVFFIELLVMFFLDMLPPIPKIATFLLDSAVLSMLIFPIFYFFVFRPLLQNIIDLRQAEEDLRTTSVAFESKDPILITDAHANILRANKKFLNFSEYSSEEIIGKNSRIFQSGRYSKDFYHKMWQHLLRNGYWAGEMHFKCKRGHISPIWVAITAVKNDQQETTHYVAIYNL